MKQAWYLTILLERTSPSYIVEANEFRDTISEEEAKIKKEAVREISNTPPATPMRNSAYFDYGGNQQIRNKTVNLSNLHNTYKMGNIQRATPVVVNRGSPTLKVPKFGDPANPNYRKSISFVEPKQN